MDFLRMSRYDAGTGHSLLDGGQHTYSSSTVRRAFIVWLHCGQRNEFRDVCNYYHHLEAMENQLPSAVRAASRSYEEELFTRQPPTSPYLTENFPHLYPQNTDRTYLKAWETLRNEALDVTRVIHNGQTKHVKDNRNIKDVQCVDLKNKENVKGQVKIVDVTDVEVEKKVPKEKGQGFMNEISGTTKHEIVEVSQMIRNHCKNHLIPLNQFLNEFKEFGERSELKNTVHNVSFFIKRKMIHAELKMINDQKVHLKTFEDEFDLISFEDAKKKDVAKAKVDNVNGNITSNDAKVPKNNGVSENSKVEAVSLDIVKKEDIKNGEPGSVKILSRDDGKSNSGFSNSVLPLDTLKSRKI